MGFFKKRILARTGINGKIEANILNAFDYLKQEISKKDLIKFHNKNQAAFLLFTWSMALEVQFFVYGNEAVLDDSDVRDKMFLLCIKVLKGMGYKITIDYSYKKLINKDLKLGNYGGEYMFSVLRMDKLSYQEAIMKTVRVIKQNL